HTFSHPRYSPHFPVRHPDPRLPHSFPTRRSSDLPYAIGFDIRRAGLTPRHIAGFSHCPRECPCHSNGPHSISDGIGPHRGISDRSEEHTSELQSRFDLVCRLLLEKKKKNKRIH